MANKTKTVTTAFKRTFQIFFAVLFISCIAIAVGIYFKYGKDIVKLYAEAQEIVEKSTEKDFKATETTLVYDANNNLMKTLKGEKDLYYLDSEDIPDKVKKAIVCIEDKKFYEHNGIDIYGIMRASIALLKNNMQITQGASTITQQLTKNIYLNQNQKWTRKIKEAFISVGIEKKYSKDQILEFYINNIYFGNGYYGIQAASNGYFKKSVDELNMSQIAFLCALPNNPTMYDPYTNMDKALTRRDRILKQMNEDGMLKDDEYQDALDYKIKVKKKKEAKTNSVESFVIDSATKALMRENGFNFKYSFESKETQTEYDKNYKAMYTECQQSLYTAGYRIYTSIDGTKQTALQNSVNESLQNFSEKDKDGIYKLQASATCIDNETGRVVAIVGGRTSDKVKTYFLNRAFQSYRQPGSSIKPLIVYTPAIETGYTPDSIVTDQEIKDGPKNSGGGYAGKMTLRKALEQSRNTVAWQLFDEITPQVGISYLKKMCFNRVVDTDCTLAASVGGFTYGTNTLEMASAYSTIENGGKYRTPTCIVKITDSDGNDIVKDASDETQVYEKNAAAMMTDMMTGVLTHGTAAGMGISNGMPCAGKTGTTDDNKDGWFCGFSPYYTTTVWIGYDTPQTLTGLYGSSYPCKAWKSFMDLIHQGLPIKQFPEYENVKSTKGDKEEATTEEKKKKKTTAEPDNDTENVTTTQTPVNTTQQAVVTTQAPADTTSAPADTTSEPATTEQQKDPDDDLVGQE